MHKEAKQRGRLTTFQSHFYFPIQSHSIPLALLPRKKEKCLLLQRSSQYKVQKDLSRKDQVAFHIHSQHTIISTDNKEH